MLVDWDCTVLQADEVNYNTLPTAPKNPNRPATAQYTYFFHAWQQDIAPALEDADYTYTLTFLDWNGDELGFAKAEEGTEAVAGDISNGIVVRAVYYDTPTSTPDVHTNPSDTTRKLIKNGMYIFTDGKTYTITGQEVK